jgi:hypothetical protein
MLFTLWFRRILSECKEGSEEDGYSIPSLDGEKINSYLNSIMLLTAQAGTEINKNRITKPHRTTFLSFIRKCGEDYFNPRNPSHSGY